MEVVNESSNKHPEQVIRRQKLNLNSFKNKDKGHQPLRSVKSATLAVNDNAIHDDNKRFTVSSV